VFEVEGNFPEVSYSNTQNSIEIVSVIFAVIGDECNLRPSRSAPTEVVALPKPRQEIRTPEGLLWHVFYQWIHLSDWPSVLFRPGMPNPPLRWNCALIRAAISLGVSAIKPAAVG
jgi:hypothetical protein